MVSSKRWSKLTILPSYSRFILSLAFPYFSDKITSSQDQTHTPGGILSYPSTRCTGGVNPRTRLPYPPPVRPLPLVERVTSPVTVGDSVMLSKLSDQICSIEHKDHVEHSTERRVVKHHSPKSMPEIIEETKALFKPSVDQRLPPLDPPTLSPTIKTKSRKGAPFSPQTNHFDRVFDDQYNPSCTIQSNPSVTDESCSVMATTKSFFPQLHVERSSSMAEIKESDISHSDHWTSFPQPKKTSKKKSRRFAKCESFSVLESPSQPSLSSSTTTRRNITNRLNNIPSSPYEPNTTLHKLVPSKTHQERIRNSSNHMRRVKSCDLHGKYEENRQYKQQNTL
jgi:hypothetical protein